MVHVLRLLLLLLAVIELSLAACIFTSSPRPDGAFDGNELNGLTNPASFTRLSPLGAGLFDGSFVPHMTQASSSSSSSQSSSNSIRSAAQRSGSRTA